MNEGVGLDPDRGRLLRAVLAPYADKIDRVAVFGSYATGRARPNSDIDLVIYGRLDSGEIDRLYTLFDDSALSVTVDVVAYDDALYPPLKAHIDAVAVTLFDHDDLKAPA